MCEAKRNCLSEKRRENRGSNARSMMAGVLAREGGQEREQQ